jgi:hypothetical protein
VSRPAITSLLGIASQITVRKTGNGTWERKSLDKNETTIPTQGTTIPTQGITTQGDYHAGMMLEETPMTTQGMTTKGKGLNGRIELCLSGTNTKNNFLIVL